MTTVLAPIALEFAKWGGEWLTTKLLEGAKTTVTPDQLKRAIREAVAAAEGAAPKLFFSCERQGLKGISRFLQAFFKSTALAELQRPLQGEGRPDVDFLVAAFEQEAAQHQEARKLKPELLRVWLVAFVEHYFQATANFIRFRVARQDYCEQLRNAFDDVKFAGFAVEGQEIDRAEKLADIFVMPDVREEVKSIPMSSRLRAEFLIQKVDGDRAKNLEEALSLVDPEIIAFSGHYASDKQESLIEEQRQQIAWQQEQEKGRVLSAQELVRQSKRSVLLGAPGSGKTTLMSFWAVATCSDEKDTNSGFPEDCLPILIRIRELARHPEMTVLEFAQDFAERELAVKVLPQGFFEYWLENGQALILLDGLDEVADETQRYKVVAKIESFLGQYEENPAIITSRPSGYKRDFFRTEEFPHYELQPFDDGKIDEFIDHWYDSRFELASERQRRKESLRKALKDQPRIQRLARNPLLLTIIALISRQYRKLPQKRHELYEKAVETLLSTWDDPKEINTEENLKYLEAYDFLELMRRLAYWIHSKGGTTDEEGGTLIDRDELTNQLAKFIHEMKGLERYKAKKEAKQFLDLVVRDRAGLLAQQGQDRYAFVHKTFQEYLAAMDIRERQEEGFEVVLEHVEKYLHDPHWEEVLLLLIAQQKGGNPSKVLQAILARETPYEQWLHRNLFFAAKCLAENVTVTQPGLASEIIGRLVAFEVSEEPQINKKLKQQTFQSLISLSETQFDTETIQQLQTSGKIEQLRLLEYQAELQPEQAASTLLMLFKNDPRIALSSAAASIVKLSNDASDTAVSCLLTLLENGNSDIRSYIALFLGQLDNASDPVINVLLTLLKDDNLDVRAHAAGALIKLGNGNVLDAAIKCQDICLSRQLEGGEPTELAKGNEKRQSQVKTTI